MTPVSYHNKTRGAGHRLKDDESLEAPCKDVNRTGHKFSGPNKAQTVGEATEAAYDL